MVIVRVQDPNDEELRMSAQVLALDLKAHGVTAQLEGKNAHAHIAVIFSASALQKGEVEVVDLKTMKAERVQADNATEKIASMVKQQ